MKSLFDRAARDNHVYPIGAGLIPLLYPDQRIGTTATEWTFTDLTRRLPEFAAPDLRARHSRAVVDLTVPAQRSEEHTSELQSLMRISSAVFCLKKKNTNTA